MEEQNKTIISIGVAYIMSRIASEKGNYAEVIKIWDIVKNDFSIIGDVDDYHNYSVVASNDDNYSMAFQIAERGIQQFPYNTDLLADAIYYGSNCKKYEECEKYIEVLIKRPRSSWTWRAFSFLIDYYQNLCNWEQNSQIIKEGLNIALEISKAYQKYLPSEERSYLKEYDVLMNLAKISLDEGDEKQATEYQNTALQVLKNAIANGKYAAVQCSLRYADALFQQQKYAEVIEVCNNALQFGEEIASARLGYFMYLSAQSREILFYKSKNNNEEEVLRIYDEYIAALADTGDSYIRNISRRVKILSAKSGVPAPEILVKCASGN